MSFLSFSKYLKSIDILELPPLLLYFFSLVLQTRQQGLIILPYFLQLLASAVHYPIQSFVTLFALQKLKGTAWTKNMAALHLNWICKVFRTDFTELGRLMLLDRLKQFLPILLFGQFRVVDSLPSLSLKLFVLFFQLPTCFSVRSIMKIKAAVAERTVARIMPVLAEILYIIEPTGIFYGWI